MIPRLDLTNTTEKPLHATLANVHLDFSKSIQTLLTNLVAPEVRDDGSNRLKNNLGAIEDADKALGEIASLINASLAEIRRVSALHHLWYQVEDALDQMLKQADAAVKTVREMYFDRIVTRDEDLIALLKDKQRKGTQLLGLLTNERYTPRVKAVENKHDPLVKLFAKPLARKKPLGAAKEALVQAVCDNHDLDSTTLSALLSAAAISPNDRSFEGATLLHHAASHGNIPVCQLLLSSFGADINAENGEGETAIMSAAKSGMLECVETLLAAGAAPATSSTTIMHAASETNQIHVIARVLELSRSVCRLALKGLGLHATQHSGDMPLHTAARHGHVQASMTLLEAGACPSTQTAKGETALHLWVRQGHSDMCRVLLARGADSGRRTTHGHTALHEAVLFSQVQVL
eukprot:c10693_g1_i2.p1 GENE.c10693_g1_i2~~c10693_g1_i2.p1  ORF type:complete len:417 (-),score=117.99 c10693_g1_i2:28-1242(-)